MTEPESKKTKTLTTLDQLKTLTTIVADTGDFEGKPNSLRQFCLAFDAMLGRCAPCARHKCASCHLICTILRAISFGAKIVARIATTLKVTLPVRN